MRTLRHLTPADALRIPWKNGRGTTEQLALWPEAADFVRGDWTWRISRARVESDGPFSSFPGCDRILVATRGAGVDLTHDGGSRARVRTREPHAFSGDDATHATLLAGPIDDFNVIWRRDVFGASVEALALGRRRARERFARGHAFAHVVAGACTLRVTGEEEPFELAARESAWLQECADGDEFELTGRTDACFVLVARIELAR